MSAAESFLGGCCGVVDDDLDGFDDQDLGLRNPQRAAGTSAC